MGDQGGRNNSTRVRVDHVTSDPKWRWYLLYVKGLCVVSLSQMLYVKCLCVLSRYLRCYMLKVCVLSRYLRCYMLNVCVCCLVISDVIC